MKFDIKKKGDDELDIDTSHRPGIVQRKLPVDFLLTIARVFNPNSYKQLCTRTFRSAISYLFSLVFLSFAVMVLLSLPLLTHLPQNMDRELSKFSDFSVDLNVSMSEPVYIHPLGIVIDTTSERNMTYENIVVTGHYLQMRGLVGYLLPAKLTRWDDTKRVRLSDYSNLAEKRQELVNVFFKFLMFVMPMLLILFLCWLFIRYFVAALLLSVGGWILVRLTDHRLQPSRIFNICLYALTPLIVLETINIPLGFNLFGVPLMVSLVYCIIGLFSASERGYKQ